MLGTRLRLREVPDGDGVVTRKRRHYVRRDGYVVSVDEYLDGTLIAEIDDGDGVAIPIPAWLDVASELTSDEALTGAQMACPE